MIGSEGTTTVVRRTASIAIWLCCVGVATQCPQYLGAQSLPGDSQTSNAVSSGAIIEGVALDSLREVPWSGATIVIQDLITQHVDTISADEDGHFRTSAIGGHRYLLSATDSLAALFGLQITASLRARPDSTTRVVLVLPSATSLLRLVCGSTALDGAVAGRVTSADHGADLRDVTVTVNWIATHVDVQARHMASVSQVAIAHADQGGHFVVCGLPVPLRATLVAQMGTDSTTQLVTLTGNQQFIVVAPILSSTRAEVAASTARTTESVNNLGQSQPPDQSAPFAVTVLTTSGEAIARAQVTLENGARFLTDTAGVAKLWPDRALRHHLLVRKLGFAPLAVTSSLNTDSRSLTVRLHAVVPVLQTIAVTGWRNRARAEFELRARTGIGDYFTEADIARLKPECLLDLLKRIPGIEVRKSIGCSGGVSTLRGEGTINGDPAANGCVNFVVDGGPSSGYDAVDVDDILGVEFYDETTAPIRYGNQCALVAVWTKQARTIN